MEKLKLFCECGEEFTEEEFKKHFNVCNKFKIHFKDFDSKLAKLLIEHSKPKERLLIIKFLLKQYIFIIENKIKDYFSSLVDKNKLIKKPKKLIKDKDQQYINLKEFSSSTAIKKKISLKTTLINNESNKTFFKKINSESLLKSINSSQDEEKENKKNNQMKNKSNTDLSGNKNTKSKRSFAKKSSRRNIINNIIQQSKELDFLDDFKSQSKEEEDEEDQDEEVLKSSKQKCQICKRYTKLFFLQCLHPICSNCLTKIAEKQFYELKCKKCGTEIDEKTKKQILGTKKYEELESNALKGIIGNIVQCPNPKCKEQNTFEPGEIDYNVKDENNKQLSKKAAEDYATHRCRCGFCQINFCVNCLAIPYHLGKTCQEYKKHIFAKKCRFCDSEIKSNNIGPDEDVCTEEECIKRYSYCCKKVLKCGHKCFGVLNEKKCPPCLDKDCENYGGLYDQNKDDYCKICFTEGLGSAPVVLLTCGHYVHYHCIKKRLETKWIGPKITFNHCLCPTCNKWDDCPYVHSLKKLININKKLYENIKEMSLKRFKIEGLDKDPRLTDVNSPWYNKKEEFAMKRLSFYMCYICKKPYFAGRRECGNDPNMNNEDPNKDYDPKDCVCGKDANLSGIQGVTNCPKHGKDFIEYKCKFCCKIASWFCWGNTHFCDDCHRRQCNHDYVSKYPRDKLPKCNKSTCEVGGNHPPNGEEYALGCLLCRDQMENKNSQ